MCQKDAGDSAIGLYETRSPTDFRGIQNSEIVALPDVKFGSGFTGFRIIRCAMKHATAIEVLVFVLERGELFRRDQGLVSDSLPFEVKRLDRIEMERAGNDMPFQFLGHVRRLVDTPHGTEVEFVMDLCGVGSDHEYLRGMCRSRLTFVPPIVSHEESEEEGAKALLLETSEQKVGSPFRKRLPTPFPIGLDARPCPGFT